MYQSCEFLTSDLVKPFITGIRNRTSGTFFAYNSLTLVTNSGDGEAAKQNNS